MTRPAGFRPVAACAVVLLAPLFAGAVARSADAQSFLETLKRQSTLTSTVPDNGDQNPYAIVVAPVSAGVIQQGDVLISNFNNSTNLQGLGTTIVSYNPSTKKLATFTQIPRKLAACPGGVGLTTAMTMLKSGWVIVGSTPSDDGTTGTKGAGCLLVLDSQGKLAGTLVGATVNGPWGNMAVVDNGATATLFLSNAGFNIGAPEEESPVVNEATILRLELSIPPGAPPKVTRQTVIGSGFSAQADKDVFLIGPTGLALAPNGTLYVSDAVGNRVVAIDNALNRATSAGTGREVTSGGMLRRPLAMTSAPNGHLIVVNGLNGQAVEIDPVSGKQIAALWIDANKAQTPPGSGDLFGIAMTPAGDGFYYVKDEVNTLAIAR